MTPEESLAAWKNLTDHINNCFSNPDLDALRIVLAAVSGHYHAQSDPIWLFIVGPSGTGKTSIYINAASALPNSHILGDLTPRTLLSGFRGYKGLLHEQIGTSGIMLFKDFTTIISKRHEDRMEIAAQLREVYDGSFSRETGRHPIEPWKGKVTVLAAVTPELDTQWSLMRGLGERFLNLRLLRGDGLAAALKASRQRGRETNISSRMRQLTADFVQIGSLADSPILDGAIASACISMAEVSARLRAHVPRANYGAGEILDEPCIELPTRIAKALCYMLSAHAIMFRRAPELQDLRLAARLALDCALPARASIFKALPDTGVIGTTALLTVTGIPRGSLDRHIQNMQACGVISPEVHNTVENTYSLTPEMQRLRLNAFRGVNIATWPPEAVIGARAASVTVN